MAHWFGWANADALAQDLADAWRDILGPRKGRMWQIVNAPMYELAASLRRAWWAVGRDWRRVIIDRLGTPDLVEDKPSKAN